MKFSSVFLGFVFFLTLFLLNINVVNSVNPIITINETSDVKLLLTGKYILDSKGVLSIENPSNVSKIYEVIIPLELDALIGFNRIDVSNTSNRFTFEYGKIKAYLVEPNETISVGYHIYGILEYDIYNITKNRNISMLEYYAGSFDLATNMVINLEKPQREGFIYNNDENQTLNSSPGNSSRRLVSSNIRNPTDFSCTVKSLKLFKTDVSDPMFDNGKIISQYSNISVSPFGLEEVNFFHENSNDQSVYWVSYDVFIDYIMDSNFKSTYSVERRSGGGGSKGSSGGGGSYNPIKNETDKISNILIKKSADKTVIRSGDEFEVILKVVNVNDFVINNLTLEDYIPQNYEIKDVSSSMKIINGTKLLFNINEIEEYGTFVLKYTLVNKDTLKGITYLKPATLFFEDQKFFSEGVLLINDILPDKKVFIQKEVSYLDEEYARVTIKIKNLGNVLLENLLISDEIDDNSILKEISKIFHEKGIWKIKELKPGEEWEVSYLIERNEKLDSLPNVFGVEKSSVYGTLISGEEIVTVFHEQPRTFEKVGMGLAVALLIFYLLF